MFELRSTECSVQRWLLRREYVASLFVFVTHVPKHMSRYSLFVISCQQNRFVSSSLVQSWRMEKMKFKPRLSTWALSVRKDLGPAMLL